MKRCVLKKVGLAAGVLAIGLMLPAQATPELLSLPDAAVPPSESAGGNSYAPVFSADGRFVLFASSALNLATNGNGPFQSSVGFSRMNVYLRDRVNGVTTLVSVNSGGTGGGNGDSFPAEVSTNGQYVLFESTASDLVAGDTNQTSDIFLRDLLAGATVLVSAGANGIGNGASRQAVMTPDAHYVAFTSVAGNLVANDTNGMADVFVRDVVAGLTALASPGAMATNATASLTGSDSPQITPDGHYVAFFSTATNLVPGIGRSGEIYLRDLVAGTTILTSTNARAVVQSAMGTTNAFSHDHCLSDDGRYVAFQARPVTTSVAGVVLRYDRQTGLTDVVYTNAVPLAGADEDSRNLSMTPDGRFIAFLSRAGTSASSSQVQVWDATTGTSVVASAGLTNVSPWVVICDSPTLDASGRYVAFLCTATNLAPGSTNGAQHIYLRDLQENLTRIVDAGTEDPVTLTLSSLSADGHWLAFDAYSDKQSAGDANHHYDVFVRDLATDTTELISGRDAALPSQTPNSYSGVTARCVSADGRYLAFTSLADNLVTNDTNRALDVFVRDVVTGTTRLVSVDANGAVADGASLDASISADGRLVCFSSGASNLVAALADSNKAQDVFVRDLATGTTTLVSVNTGGTGTGNNASDSPLISANGRYVLFRSRASNLAAGTFSGENLFLRDLPAGTTYALTTAGAASPSAMSPDGRWIAYGSTAGAVLVRDTVAGGIVYSNLAASLADVAISGNGNRLAYTTNGLLTVVDRDANTNAILSPSGTAPKRGLHFSADGRFLAYVTKAAQLAGDANGTNDVYIYDFVLGTNLLASGVSATGNAGAGASASPDISADGRYAAFSSLAADLVAGDANGGSDLFLYDRVTGGTTLLSANRQGNATANLPSFKAVFCGGTLVLRSWASDLTDGDYNEAGDLFAFRLAAPVVSDTDGDGMDDAWELQYFGALARNGNGDFDGDGASDLAEYQAGTNPLDAGSVFRGELIYAPTPVIAWTAAPGKTYQVQFKDHLGDAEWQDLNGSLTLVNGQWHATDPSPNATQRFYRIVTQ